MWTDVQLCKYWDYSLIYKTTEYIRDLQLPKYWDCKS